MFEFRFAVLCRLLPLLLLAGCGKSDAPRLRIAQLVPRSGPQQVVGDQAVAGTRLAVQEVNAGDKVLGRQVLVVTPASDGNPDHMEGQAVRLIRFDRVPALLGGTDAAQAERLARLASIYQLPLVTPSWLQPSGANSFSFSVGITPAQQGTVLARYLGQELKARRVALLVDSTGIPGCNELATVFAEEYRRIASQPAESKTYRKPGDLADIAAQLAKSNPEAIVLAGTPTDLQKLQTELDKAKVPATVPIFLGGEEADLGHLAVNGDRRPLYRVTAFVADDSLPRTREFVRKYQEKTLAQPDAAAALAYDSTRILFEGIRQAKEVKSDKICEALRGLKDFESLTGPLSFDGKQIAKRPAFLVKIEKAGPKLVKRYEP